MSNEGKKVKIHYVGTLDSGEKFDSSYDRGEPIEFICMGGGVIKGFDDAVKDMVVGEKKSVHIEPADAYGEKDESLIQKIPAENFANADQIPVGQDIIMQDTNGNSIPVHVVSLEDGILTLDMNHPLAGQALNFDLELVEVED